MHIAGHTMGTPELTLDEAIDLFTGIGLDGIEIIWDDGYKCALGKKAPAHERIDLRRLLAGRGLAPVCLTPYMTGINSLDSSVGDKDVKDFRHCIEVAAELEAPYIRVYGGGYQPEQDHLHRTQMEEILIDSLRIIGGYAEEAGVVLVVETHFNTLTCTAAETASIVRRVNHPAVRVLYDQPNLEFSEGERFPQALELLEGLIAMVHVKDLIYKGGLSGTTFTSAQVVTVDESERRISSRIPGEGIIPWPEILPALRAHGFDGWLSLEYERRWYPHDLPFAGEGMKQGLEYIRGLLAGLA